MSADSVNLQARLNGQRLAINDLTSGQRWSYASLDLDISRMVTALAARDISVGNRVAVLAKNCAQIVMLHFACARLGAMLVPLNWRLAEAELLDLIEDCEPSLILGDSTLEEAQISGESLAAFMSESHTSEATITKSINRSRPSLLLYTSGTSGRPKGVLLSESNLEETGINFGLLTHVSEKSVFLCDAPMFHIIGLVTNIRPALLCGASIAISNGFVAEQTYERLCDPALAVTHYVCVPQMAAMIRSIPTFDASRLKHMHTLVTGGAPHAPSEIKAWLDDGVMVTNGYGMSEVGTVFNMPLDMSVSKKKAGSVGISSHRIETKIVDARGRKVRAGTPGELLIRGPNVTKGYWQRAEANQEAFSRGAWFRSGDIVMCDTDGFHWLVDRRKDMFISGGENVYPAEIENAVMELEGMIECAVVAAPDVRWGEVGHLFWCDSTGKQTREKLLDHLSLKLAKYKIPKHFKRLDALPRNGSGKILKTDLKRLSADLLT